MPEAAPATRLRPTGRDWLQLMAAVGLGLALLVVVSLRSAAARELTVERCVEMWNATPPVERVDAQVVRIDLNAERYGAHCRFSWSVADGGGCRVWVHWRDDARWQTGGRVCDEADVELAARSVIGVNRLEEAAPAG